MSSKADTCGCPGDSLTIDFTNTSAVEHIWHIFSEPPEISTNDDIWIQAIRSVKVPSKGSTTFVISRELYAMCAGGSPNCPQFPDFFGPVVLANKTANGTRIKMAVTDQRAHFNPPASQTVQALGAFNIQTNDSFDQGSGYSCGVAILDRDHGKITMASTQANPMAEIEIHVAPNLWICWGDLPQEMMKPTDLARVVNQKGGVIAKIPYLDGEQRRVVNYMPNGHYTDGKGNQYEELPRPE